MPPRPKPKPKREPIPKASGWWVLFDVFLGSSLVIGAVAQVESYGVIWFCDRFIDRGVEVPAGNADYRTIHILGSKLAFGNGDQAPVFDIEGSAATGYYVNGYALTTSDFATRLTLRRLDGTEFQFWRAPAGWFQMFRWGFPPRAWFDESGQVVWRVVEDDYRIYALMFGFIVIGFTLAAFARGTILDWHFTRLERKNGRSGRSRELMGSKFVYKTQVGASLPHYVLWTLLTIASIPFLLTALAFVPLAVVVFVAILPFWFALKLWGMVVDACGSETGSHSRRDDDWMPSPSIYPDTQGGYIPDTGSRVPGTSSAGY